MATFVRNRVLDKLSWPEEEEVLRSRRREILCELDGLLAQLEEYNLRAQAIPGRVLVQLRRLGVVFPPRVTPAELIEAVFAAQEGFVRQPVGLPTPGRSGLDAGSRLAS